jgi:anion-transporting  ArsA/GET3 family ATPase
VPEGPLTSSARDLRALLLDARRTATILVTLAEEMPVNESRELTAALDRELGLRVSHVVINQVYPSRFEAGSLPARVLDAVEAGPGAAPPAAPAANVGADAQRDLAALIAHSQLAHGRRLLNERYIAELERSLSIAHSQLPFLFVPSIGPDEIRTLSRTLEERLGA